jgi:hypothetical protein
MFIFIRYFFRVEASRREKIKCNITLALSSIILIVLCLVGYTIVYARSYDIMNEQPILIFDYNEEDTVLTFLGTEIFDMKKDAR